MVGSEKANQKSAVATSVVSCGVNSPRWKTSRIIGSERTRTAAAAGSRTKRIWRIPLAIVARRLSCSPRAAKRARVGKRTVAIATEKIPCGSW